MLLKDVNKVPSRPENAPHQYTYKPTPYPQQDTVITSNTSSEVQQAPVPLSAAPEAPHRPEKGMMYGIHPEELVKLAPRLKTDLRRPSPTWSEIIDAVDWLRHDLDLETPLGRCR